MKQENLDELRNIYLGLVTGGEGPELLSETPTLNRGLTGLLGLPQIGPSSSEIQKNFQRGEEQRKQEKVDRATNQRAQLGVVRAGNKYIAKSDTTAYDTEKGAQAIMLANRLNRETGLGKSKPVKPPVKTEPVKTAPRPAASGPVLSKLKGVEGTGVGANFKAKAFTDTERTRYSSVAAAKPAIPTGTTAGGTKFERRTPTSAELGAAQASRAAGGSEESAIKAGVNASKPVAPVGDKFGTTSTIKPPSPTQVKSDTPTTQLTKMQPSSSDNSGETDRLKKALDIKKSDVTSSYQFPMSKTLRDLSDSYNEIYEAKKKLDLVGQEDDDIDNDGDTDKSDKYLLNRRKVRSKAIGEATAMSKRGLDEPAIRNQIASKTRGGSFADKATALADKETYGDKKKKEGREKFARKQRGDFRDTTSSSPGLRGYGHQSSDPAVKAKQDARGNQRARVALTPNERKQNNMESYDLFDYIMEYLITEGYADTNENALVIMANMSEDWRESIVEGYKPLPVGKMIRQTGTKAFKHGMKIGKNPLAPDDGDNTSTQTGTMSAIAQLHDPEKAKAKSKYKG